MKTVIATLALVVFGSIFLEDWAGPNAEGVAEGFKGMMYMLFEASGLLAVMRDTCLLVAGVILFDRLYLPAVDTWNLIRYGSVGKGAESQDLSDDRVASALRYQSIVVGFFTLGLAWVIYTS